MYIFIILLKVIIIKIFVMNVSSVKIKKDLFFFLCGFKCYEVYGCLLLNIFKI